MSVNFLTILMHKKTKIVITVACIAAFSLYAFYALFTDFLHIYILRNDNAGTILWNGKEAYLFMMVASRGVRMSYAEYPWAALMEWLGAARPPNDQCVFLYVIHVTPSGPERHLALVQQDTAGVPHSYTPLGEYIYTFCNGTLCKWTGERFDGATAEEQQKIGGIERLSSDSNTSVNGWSKRGVRSVAGDFQFSVPIGNQVTLKIKQGNVYKSTSDSPVIVNGAPWSALSRGVARQ
jgi:hypothetical protein